jgi:dihydrofolate reductase
MPRLNLPRLNLIAALARNRVIGIDNRLPWRLPEDLAHFKAVTMGCPVVMGRKTFESLKSPLPGRTNIVVTRNADYRPAGVLAVDSIPAALAACADAAEVFVIGGAEIYRQALPLVARLFLTEVDVEADGDAWFPAFDPAQFREVSREVRQGEKGDALRFAFVVYERV